MKYKIKTLDGRHSYNDQFDYYVSFGGHMNNNSGPLHFNRALQWMIQTWGWSAEVRLHRHISMHIERNATMVRSMFLRVAGIPALDTELPPECNPRWTWSNQFDDLRIYLKSNAELAWFQLAHPVDQK